MRATRGVYIAAAAGGALLLGVAALALTSKPASAQTPPSPSPTPGPTPPQPAPAPPPPPAPIVIPGIMDDVPQDFVVDSQQRLAQVIASGKIPNMTSGPLNLPLYTPQDVDGDRSNSKFVTALAAFQSAVHNSITRTALNTQGRLDYLTAAVLLVVEVGFVGYSTTFGITDPADIAMAQKALLDQSKMTPLPSGFQVDGTISAAFTQSLAAWQVFIKGEPFPGINAARSDGTLDWWSLGTLLVQAYAL